MAQSANERRLQGSRFEISLSDELYPESLRPLDHPPQCLYVIGDPAVLIEGLAVVGARKATPYGISCARHFAAMAARHDIVIISGGARGCDTAAHEAALGEKGKTVAFLGGGCDEPYPVENIPLFQRIIDAGGAVVSENEWDFKPLPYTFRERNRLIAGMSRATLIVEAGLPSGTFSTADAALAANRDVLVVPGAITSFTSRGANRLIYQGATPVVDDDTFEDQLFSIFGCLCFSPGDDEKAAAQSGSGAASTGKASELLAALQAQSLSLEEMRNFAISKTIFGKGDPTTSLMVWLAEAQRDGLIAQYPDGRYGACLGKRR